MIPTPYHNQLDSSGLDGFLDTIFGTQMKFFASDLLSQGLSTEEIMEAVKRAVAAARTSGVPVRQHFQLLYTQTRDGMVRDCKLTRFGYALTLLNAEPSARVVADFQLKLLRHLL